MEGYTPAEAPLDVGNQERARIEAIVQSNLEQQSQEDAEATRQLLAGERKPQWGDPTEAIAAVATDEDLANLPDTTRQLVEDYKKAAQAAEAPEKDLAEAEVEEKTPEEPQVEAKVDSLGAEETDREATAEIHQGKSNDHQIQDPEQARLVAEAMGPGMTRAVATEAYLESLGPKVKDSERSYYRESAKMDREQANRAAARVEQALATAPDALPQLEPVATNAEPTDNDRVRLEASMREALVRDDKERQQLLGGERKPMFGDNIADISAATEDLSTLPSDTMREQVELFRAEQAAGEEDSVEPHGRYKL
ncbi:MAG TPA: hypothetical protein VF401_03580 [Candidatus Saccharimonadales bacterium]